MTTLIPKNLNISLAALILFQGLSFAHADITDLPDLSPGAGSSYSAQQRGSVRIENISRKTKGETLRVNLTKPLALNTIEVFVRSGSLTVYSTYLITSDDKKIAVRELTQTDKLATNKLYVSENLNLKDSVRAIEIQAESYEAGTEISVDAISNSGKPNLIVTRETEPAVKPELAKPEPSKPQPVKKAPNKPAEKKPAAKLEPRKQPAPERAQVIPFVGKVVGYFNSWDRPDIGRVKEIFENNMVLLAISATETKVVAAKDLYNVSKCNSSGTLCAESRIMLQKSYRYSPGKIYGYFADKYTLVVEDESPEYITYAEPQLVTAVRSCDNSGNICIGTKVVVVTDYEVYSGKATSFLPNGKIGVRHDNDQTYTDDYEASTVFRALTTNCADRICVSDRVLYNDGYNYVPAKVIKIYDGKIVVIQKDGETQQVYTRPSRLSKAK